MIHDHTLIGWKAWYTEDRFYSSSDTNWINLPNDGLLIVMVYEAQKTPQGENYRIIYKGMDYYWADSDSGLKIFKSNTYPPIKTSLIKRGIWVSDEEYQKTLAKTDLSEHLLF